MGGLPRVAELFEVRKPKDMAVVSEIAGTVSFAGEAKGKRKLIVTPEVGESKEYLVPKGKHITVSDGDFVECGDLLTEGNPELHDILRTKGEKYLAAYLVDEIQEVYRFQGVGIDDKHIEVIVRQMLRKVTVTEPGGTSFLVGEQVDKAEFKAENQKAMAEGRSPATAEPLVLGITQASLTTSSFISRPPSRRPPRCSPRRPSRARWTTCAALRKTSSSAALSPPGRATANTWIRTSRSRIRRNAPTASLTSSAAIRSSPIWTDKRQRLRCGEEELLRIEAGT